MDSAAEVAVRRYGRLDVHIFPDRKMLGEQAAQMAAGKLRQLLGEKEQVNAVFAAAPSQLEFLQALRPAQGISWERVNAFHMDEYIGLQKGAAQSFGTFLNNALFQHLPFRAIHYLDGNAADMAGEAVHYAGLLQAHRPDIVFLGIGENAHLAFNDPSEAKFNDPVLLKVVHLDEVCRQQQVNDKCFDKLEDVPHEAITLTIPALLMGTYLFCMVPGRTKANAVRKTLFEPVNEHFPSTILRTHPSATLFLDSESAKLI